MALKISAASDESIRSTKNSGGLFLGVVFVLLLVGILSLSVWLSELTRSSSSNFESIENRLAILEEQLQLADSTSTDFLSDINTQLQFLDKEIRKLWDLSNKRNKPNIEQLSKDSQKQSKLLKELALTQTNDQKNIKAIEMQAKQLNIMLGEYVTSNLESTQLQDKITELSNSLLMLEETVQAFDSYRLQNNATLKELQLQISQTQASP